MKRKIIVYFLLWLYWVFLIWDYNNNPELENLKNILDFLDDKLIIFGFVAFLFAMVINIFASIRFKNEKKQDDHFNKLIKKYAILFFVVACIGIIFKFISQS